MLEYRIIARRLDAHDSEATCKNARLDLDTDPQGRPDAFNPAELLLAAVAACMIKNIERVAPLLKLEIRGVEVSVHGARQDSPPKMVSLTYGFASSAANILTKTPFGVLKNRIRMDLVH